MLAVCYPFFLCAPAHADDTAAKAEILSQRMIPDEFSSQNRIVVHRPARRVRIYGAPLSPNAVRVCNAYYVQEFRPSGTVIVPRMNCYWRG
ncbi:MAG: hypothetical protein AB1342_02245 [Pseudomonadota bacterium]